MYESCLVVNVMMAIRVPTRFACGEGTATWLTRLTRESDAEWPLEELPRIIQKKRTVMKTRTAALNAEVGTCRLTGLASFFSRSGSSPT